MAGLREAVKPLRVLLAVVGVGFSASYGVRLARAARSPGGLGAALRGVRALDDRFANPARVLLLVTGLLMAWLASWPPTTLWISASLALWLVAAVLGIAACSPTLRRRIVVLESEGPSSREFARLSRRGTLLGVVLAVDVPAIVARVVLKPTPG